MMNIKIKIDNTDHFGLFCPYCDKIMRITEVNTKKGEKTIITAICDQCNGEGHRKIYWNKDGGRFLK